jgi:hypothetical protein
MLTASLEPIKLLNFSSNSTVLGPIISQPVERHFYQSPLWGKNRESLHYLKGNLVLSQRVTERNKKSFLLCSGVVKL